MPPKAFWITLGATAVTAALIAVNVYLLMQVRSSETTAGITPTTSPVKITEYSLSGKIKSVTSSSIVFDFTGTADQKYAAQEKTYPFRSTVTVRSLVKKGTGLTSTPATLADVRAGSQAVIYATSPLTDVASPILTRIDLISR